MKVRLAVFKQSGTKHCVENAIYWQSYMDDVAGYVRCTEYVDIDFPDRAPEETVERELATLNEMEQALRAELAEKLQVIDRQRAELTAIKYEPTELRRVEPPPSAHTDLPF